MKNLITKNLLKFSLVTVILTTIFRLGLSYTLSNELYIITIVVSVIYGLSMFMNGRYFGRKEFEFLPIYDVGFRFHFSTFLCHNLVSILWFVFGFESQHENISVIYITAVIWSAFLLVHFLYFLSARKSAIKNLNKNDLFE